MFTGIVEERGVVRSAVRIGQSLILTVSCTRVLEDLHTGDSVAVDGACLTATTVGKISDGKFTVDVMPETFRRTSLHLLHNGSYVNLERALKAGGRFGGHIVTGHIDGTGVIQSLAKDGNALVCTIRTVSSIISGIVEKGSVAVDGISLTVISVHGKENGVGCFSAAVIPHTRCCTALSEKRSGSIVNIECDILGKYVARYAGSLETKKDQVWNRQQTEQDLLQ